MNRLVKFDGNRMIKRSTDCLSVRDRSLFSLWRVASCSLAVTTTNQAVPNKYRSMCYDHFSRSLPPPCFLFLYSDHQHPALLWITRKALLLFVFKFESAKQLPRSRRNYSKPRSGVPNEVFIPCRASPFDCAGYPLKAQCCANTRTRKAIRSQHDNTLTRQPYRLPG